MLRGGQDTGNLNRKHYLAFGGENWHWKRLLTYRKADYGMKV